MKISNTSRHARVSGGDKGTIVLVDDSKMSRNMLAAIVTKAGYTVIGEASNGIEGYETYLKLKPDIITLDITMPEMDGLDALKRILDAEPDAKAIMITAAGQQDKLIEALEVGAKRFISKPFQEDEIVNNINDVMNL
ncbi:MAG: response regulator [Lachnospiraceae bacterium]|nr:response regulator [Lachnospiraceae bacterium]